MWSRQVSPHQCSKAVPYVRVTTTPSHRTSTSFVYTKAHPSTGHNASATTSTFDHSNGYHSTGHKHKHHHQWQPKNHHQSPQHLEGEEDVKQAVYGLGMLTWMLALVPIELFRWQLSGIALYMFLGTSCKRKVSEARVPKFRWINKKQ